jgi:hypothetical protein
VAALPAIAGAGVALADRALAGDSEAAQLLGVDVDQIAGAGALVAVGRLGSAAGDPAWRRGATEQAGLSLCTPTAKPLASTSLADAGGLGSRPSDQPPSMRSTIRRLLFGQVRALAWSFIRCPPCCLGWLDTPSL